MGKGTDKLYITHSEWASEDAFSASVGANASQGAKGSAQSSAKFKRLPLNFCAFTLGPFKRPVCTPSGTIFDLAGIKSWIAKNGTNPVDGKPLAQSDLIPLNFMKNDDGEFVDPATYKPITDNSHVVALRPSGNVYHWQTIQQLNIQPKNWRDLVSDCEFSREDIITLQDPHQLESRDLSKFKFLEDGFRKPTPEPEEDIEAKVKASSAKTAEKLNRVKEAVTKAREQRSLAELNSKNQHSRSRHGIDSSKPDSTSSHESSQTKSPAERPARSQNLAHYTTGLTAASFTSTGLAPRTRTDFAVLSDEDCMLKPRHVKCKGFMTMDTDHGKLKFELYPEFAPKAVWNFIKLAEKGYYKKMPFHRNIRNFMIQGGDPTGTGRGGNSIWDSPFDDEVEGPRVHDSRGVLSMANKGKDTNTSQFFITYRAARHLDRKHTVFGKLVDGEDTLARMEAVAQSPGAISQPPEHPQPVLVDVTVLIDPFEETRKLTAEKLEATRKSFEISCGPGTNDDNYTWTGKRIGGGSLGNSRRENQDESVGKYLKTALQHSASRAQGAVHDTSLHDIFPPLDPEPEPVKKRPRIQGGFGDFSSW